MKNATVLIPITVLGLAGLGITAYFIFRKKDDKMKTISPLNETISPLNETIIVDPIGQLPNDNNFNNPPQDDLVIFEDNNTGYAGTGTAGTGSADINPNNPDLLEDLHPIDKLPPTTIDVNIYEVMKKMSVTNGIYAPIKAARILYTGLDNIGKKIFSSIYTLEKWEGSVYMNWPNYANEIVTYRKQAGTEKAKLVFGKMIGIK